MCLPRCIATRDPRLPRCIATWLFLSMPCVGNSCSVCIRFSGLSTHLRGLASCLPRPGPADSLAACVKVAMVLPPGSATTDHLSSIRSAVVLSTVVACIARAARRSMEPRDPAVSVSRDPGAFTALPFTLSAVTVCCQRKHGRWRRRVLWRRQRPDESCNWCNKCARHGRSRHGETLKRQKSNSEHSKYTSTITYANSSP